MTNELGLSEFEIEVTQEQLLTIAELINRQVTLEDIIELKESELKDWKKQLAKIEQGSLPDALQAAGLSEFKTIKGEKIVVKEDISVSVPKNKLDDIVAWLEKNGHGETVTGKVYVDLPRNSDNERKAAIEALVNAGLEPVESMTVNTMTLKAILKKHLADGDNIDLADFGAFSWRKAEIKRP